MEEFNSLDAQRVGRQSPYLSHLNQQVATMMRIATEFGFTPASRSRIFSWDQKNSLLLEVPKKSDLDW
jgi:phage terminase small subunit